MKRSLLTVLTSLLFGMTLFGAEDASGTWSGSPFYMVLKQEGGKVTGTCGPGRSQQGTIENGQIQSDRMTFNVGPFMFDLRVSGDEIKGEMHKGTDEAMNIYLKRVTSVPNGVATPLEFDVASVKRSQPAMGARVSASTKFSSGRFTCSNLALHYLIAQAYRVQDYQVSGPDWMTTELYDVIATMPPATDADDVLLMLQRLLAERFRLTLHRETKELPVYGLIPGKNGPKLKQVDRSFSGGGLNSPGHLILPSVNMEGLATILSRRMDRPVLDMTGMRGYFEVSLEWTPDGYRITPPVDGASAGTSIFTAIQEQSGLKLEARKAPIEMIIVDHVEKVPAGN